MVRTYSTIDGIYKIVMTDARIYNLQIKVGTVVAVERTIDFDEYQKDKAGTIAKAIVPAQADKGDLTSKKLEELMKPLINAVAKKVLLK